MPMAQGKKMYNPSQRGKTAERLVLGWTGIWLGCGILAVPYLAAKSEVVSSDELILALFLPLLILQAHKAFALGSYRRLWPFMALMGTMVAGLFWTPPSELNRGVMRLAYLVVGYVLGRIIVGNLNSQSLYRGFLASGIAMGLFLLIRVVMEGDLRGFVEFDVDGNSILNKNAQAYHFCFLSLVCWAAIRRRPEWFAGTIVRNAMRAGTLLLPLCVVLSGSRGAFFTGVALLLLNGWRFLTFGRIAGLLGGATVLAAMIQMYSGEDTRTLFTRLSKGDETLYSAGGRVEIWAALPEVIRANPRIVLIGGGTGSADYYLGPYVERKKEATDEIVRKHSHSSYLEWVLCHGALGCVLALAGMVSLCRGALKYDRRTGGKLGASLMVFWGMSSFTTVTWMHPFFVVFFAMLVDVYVRQAFPGRHPDSIFNDDSPARRARGGVAAGGAVRA